MSSGEGRKHLYKKLGLILMAILCFAGTPLANGPVRYLAFQIFTGVDSDALRKAFPPPPTDLRRTAVDLRDHIGVAGRNDRQLGFILGLISFDNYDEVRNLIVANKGMGTSLEPL